MTEFFSALKADLLDRRMLPLLVLAGVALIGALAYAMLGGGSGSAQPPGAPAASPLPRFSSASSISASPAPSATDQPVAETTSGSAHRSAGAARNPFAPLPGAKAAASAASAATLGSSTTASPGPSSSPTSGSPTGASPEASGGSSSGTQGGGGSVTPKSKSAPGKGKNHTVYRVNVLFGAVPAGTPAPSPGLTSYENLKRQQPLPSTKQPLVIFRGVIAGGKSATFTLVGEAILRGNAACLPSDSQCQAIDLKLGETEELEYVPPEGAPVVYQLQLVSVIASKATAASARRAFRGESKTGLRLLRAVGLSALPGLRYSRAKGVLVFAKHPAFAARARTAAWGASRWR